MSPDQHHKDLEALKAQIDTLSPVAARFVARLIGSGSCQGEGGYSRCSPRAASAAPMPISSPVPISASV